MHLPLDVYLTLAAQLTEDSTINLGLAGLAGGVVVAAVAFAVNAKRDVTQLTAQIAREAELQAKRDAKVDAMEAERLELGRTIGALSQRVEHGQLDIERLQREKADAARFESFERVLHDLGTTLKDVRDRVHEVSTQVTTLNARERLRSEQEAARRKDDQ